MPLTLVRSDSNANLWQTCVSRFLDELGDARGGTEHESHLWVTHRTQRNLLLEAAEERKIPGWLSPPFSFFSELPHRFNIELRPLGHLTARLLLTSIAKSVALRHEFSEAEDGGHIHIDRVLWELLPEGIGPDELETALDQLDGDEFTKQRNRWLLDTYRDYLSQVADHGYFDSRSTHSLIADQIRRGGLPAALGGPNQLHIYGLTSLRGRVRLFEALSAQNDVEVCAYVPLNLELGEWERLANKVEDLRKKVTTTDPIVQPVPNGLREANWVARSIKALLLEGDVQPHHIAVWARFGREDTRQIREALNRVDIPNTARNRYQLSEIPALRAVLGLFEAVGDNWSWSTLRSMLTSPYFATPINLRSFEYLASRSYPKGLSQWLEKLERLRKQLDIENVGWKIKNDGVRHASIEEGIAVLKYFMKATNALSHPRSISDWIESTRQLIRGHPLGIRQKVCESVGDHWDMVRIDQRGTLALEQFLREWSELLPKNDDEVGADTWHFELKKVLESNEIALSTPLQGGVQVLEAHEAAMTPFEHVFIVHANEGIFPFFPQRGGLFTEGERERLSDLGIPLPTYKLHLEREQRLWQACSGSPKVVATFRKTDMAGHDQLPSMFLTSYKEETELPPPTKLGSELSPITHAELLAHEIDRFTRLRQGEDSAVFQTPDPHVIQHAALSAFADQLRNGGLDNFTKTVTGVQTERLVADETATLDAKERPLSQRPTAWNGQIRDPVALALIRKKFWERREWSASKLELYSQRPFDFLLKEILKLTELEEISYDLSPLNEGNLAHKVLECFYQQLDADSSTEQALDQLAQTFDEVCDHYEEDDLSWVGLPHVWAVKRTRLGKELRAFVKWEREPGRSAKPLGLTVAVEFAFGWSPDGSNDSEAVDLSGPDERGDERRLLLSGKIDRVDRIHTDDGERLRVVDYKRGGVPKRIEYEDAASIQMPLYMASVERIFEEEVKEGVHRVWRPNPGSRTKVEPKDVESVLKLARQIPDRIRAGNFEAVQARTKKLAGWKPGKDVTRTSAQITTGNRFQPVVPILSSLFGAQADDLESEMSE
jgi:RecB family exonuclease